MKRLFGNHGGGEMSGTNPDGAANPAAITFASTDNGDVHRFTPQADRQDPAYFDDDAADTQPIPHEPAPDPVTDSGVHALPDPVRDPSVLYGHKVDCHACHGQGFVIVSTRDVLRQVVPLLDDAGPVVVVEFYTQLIHAAPDLAYLFPSDLLTEDSIKGQREKLLGALRALFTLYDPDDDAAMAKLTAALQGFGRDHADFHRKDGSRRGATFDEYAAVKAALFDVLRKAAGSQWRPEFGPACSEAYDFAAVTMLAEQYRTVSAVARMPRQSAAQPLRSVLA